MVKATTQLPSKRDYVKALKELMSQDAISDAQLRMLRFHYQAPEAIVTTHELAEAAGYSTTRSVNLQYGLLGSKLRKVLGKKGNIGGQKSHIVAWFHPPTPEFRYWLWVMQEPLRKAIADLNWFDEEMLGADPSEVREFAALEGDLRASLVSHRKRERSLRAAKIADAARNNPRGRLICEVPGCGFDFAATYGEIGVGFAEVHHRVPLSQYTELEETSLSDLAILCSNCHRMVHRGGACRDMNALLPKLMRRAAKRKRSA